MTISYSGNFVTLLLRWKGSLWKTIWKQLLIFMALYYSINLVIRMALTPEQIVSVLRVKRFCKTAQDRIPLLFLLGFYVGSMVLRWWDQFKTICWPDRFMLFITSAVRGHDDDVRMYRRSIARWCNLMSVLCWRDMSVTLRKRFPTIQHVIRAGLMTEKEHVLYENTNAAYGKWWLPCIWISNLLRKMEADGILMSVEVKQLIKEVDAYRGGFGMLACYDWISVPLVYTHVATIATFGYFLCSLFSDQIIPGHDELDTFIPILTVLQFIFYIGWLKVGEDLMSPLGEDDDDFEMNWILDRNVQIAFMMADQLHGQLPPLEKDKYWNVKNPKMPHTYASAQVQQNIFPGHLCNFKMSDEDMEIIPEDTAETDEEAAAKVKAAKKAADRPQMLVVPDLPDDVLDTLWPEYDKMDTLKLRCSRPAPPGQSSSYAHNKSSSSISGISMDHHKHFKTKDWWQRAGRKARMLALGVHQDAQAEQMETVLNLSDDYEEGESSNGGEGELRNDDGSAASDYGTVSGEPSSPAAGTTPLLVEAPQSQVRRAMSPQEGIRRQRRQLVDEDDE